MRNIKIIGRKGCSRCEMFKRKLDSSNVEYEYRLIRDLIEEEKEEMLEILRDYEYGQLLHLNQIKD